MYLDCIIKQLVLACMLQAELATDGEAGTAGGQQDGQLVDVVDREGEAKEAPNMDAAGVFNQCDMQCCSPCTVQCSFLIESNAQLSGMGYA